MKYNQKSENKLYGCQTPTYKWCENYDKTLGDICIEFIESYDISLFEWEKNFINDCLALDPNDAFMNMLIGLCVPRRNGKTLIVCVLSIFFLTVYPSYVGLQEINILYSSHAVKTNMETFEMMLGYFDDKEKYPDLYELTHWGPRYNGIGKANGKERIECKWEDDKVRYHTKISFNARSKSAARGIGTNLIIFDEAQELTSEQTAAMLPTAGSSKTEQMIIYLGTPDYPGCPGDRFKDLRNRAWEKKPTGVCWTEWSTSEIGDITDRNRWAATNPSLGYVLSERWIETAELNGMSEDDFARERLGYWANEEELLDLPIPKEDWIRCEVDKPQNEGLTCYGVKFDLTGLHASVSACVKNEDNFYVELINVYNCKNGMNDLVEFLTSIGRKAAQIIIDGRGTSYDLQQRLLQNKVPKSAIIVTKTNDLTDACSMLANAVVTHEITHYDKQWQLNDSATTCTRRIVGNKGAWGFEDSDKGWAFIIESAALAYFASRTTKRNPKRKGRIG